MNNVETARDLIGFIDLLKSRNAYVTIGAKDIMVDINGTRFFGVSLDGGHVGTCMFYQPSDENEWGIAQFVLNKQNSIGVYESGIYEVKFTRKYFEEIREELLKPRSALLHELLARYELERK